MLPSYRDILDAVGREPLWYSEPGVPRFAPFAPSMLGVYDEWAVLAEVPCVACPKVLLVGLGGSSSLHLLLDHERFFDTIEEFVESATCFGDPPHHCCPGGGDTMVSGDVRIVEVWERRRTVWSRRPDLEDGGHARS